MPYVDPDQQRAYNRDWHRQRLELCPRCPNLKCPESVLCRECRHDARRVAAGPDAPLKGRAGQGGSTGRPQPSGHPWRRSLTRVAA